VNVRDGARVWTMRASDTGDWQIALGDLTPGWHQLTAGQVVDSPAGGGWVESCPSPALPVGVGSAVGPAPVLQLPGGLTGDAASAAGAAIAYDARATTAAGVSLSIDCQPASGVVFPIGVSDVLCTAFDPAAQAVAVGTFAVTIVDGPPIVDVPADFVAEADSALGALVSYEATATDAVSGPLPVECTPSAAPGHPVLFPLGEQSTVTCQATDGAGQTTSRTFVVRVVVSWSDLLAPINPLGLTSFLRGLPIAVKFALTGGSAGIGNLPARLFVAPVDGAGNVGAERPAVGVAPAVENLFQYLPVAHQYLLTLNTLGMQAGVWRLRVDLGDGVPHFARIRLL
jgi:hypothetical protein